VRWSHEDALARLAVLAVIDSGEEASADMDVIE